MISTHTWDCPKCGPDKGKDKVIEFYNEDQTEFCTEHWVYFCTHCGWIYKKTVNRLTKEIAEREINFK